MMPNAKISEDPANHKNCSYIAKLDEVSPLSLRHNDVSIIIVILPRFMMKSVDCIETSY